MALRTWAKHVWHDLWHSRALAKARADIEWLVSEKARLEKALVVLGRPRPDPAKASQDWADLHKAQDDATGAYEDAVMELADFLTTGTMRKGCGATAFETLSVQATATVLWYMSEVLGLLPDWVECCQCGNVYNSEREGHYCENCGPLCDSCRDDCHCDDGEGEEGDDGTECTAGAE